MPLAADVVEALHGVNGAVERGADGAILGFVDPRPELAGNRHRVAHIERAQRQARGLVDRDAGHRDELMVHRDQERRGQKSSPSRPRTSLALTCTSPFISASMLMPHLAVRAARTAGWHAETGAARCWSWRGLQCIGPCRQTG